MDGQGNADAGGSQCDIVARAFVDHYYRTFDFDRAALSALYGQTSMLSFEGHAVAGAEEIGQKLAQLPFQQCRHTVSTVDCQPSPSFPGTILVFVSGNLQLAGEEHQLRFSQVGHLGSTRLFLPNCFRAGGLNYDAVIQSWSADVSAGTQRAGELLRAE